MRFTTPEIEMELRHVIDIVFPNLAMFDKNMLLKYYLRIIDIIAYSFGFTERKQDFMIQLKQNNYRDAKGILLLLLPFINDMSDSANIKTLNDIYVAKKDNSVDISIDEPK